MFYGPPRPPVLAHSHAWLRSRAGPAARAGGGEPAGAGFRHHRCRATIDWCTGERSVALKVAAPATPGGPLSSVSGGAAARQLAPGAATIGTGRAAALTGEAL